MNYKIRIARAEDVPAIAEIERLTSPEPWSEQSLMHDVTENDLAIVIVAECMDKVDCLRIDKDSTAGILDNTAPVIAYADVWKVADELQLNNIAVLEAYRGNHIATEMLGVLVETGRELGCALITLEVRAGNAPAIGLYRRAGFNEVGVRERYYIDNGEDAILMDKNL